MTNETELLKLLAQRSGEMAEDLIEISRIPAVNPRMNGKGEFERAQWLRQRLEKAGLHCQSVDVPDEAVPQTLRPNLYVRFEGAKNTAKTLWLIAHLDTVDTGDLALWNTDPFAPVLRDGKIYGLGCEDNTQAVIVCLHLALLMQKNQIQPDCNVAFLFVSDEETGSRYGLHALIEKGLFGKEDEALVPDGGSPDGSFVEIAEKSQVWLRVSVQGKQGHAAMPHLGVNACSAGMHLGVEIEDSLKKEFDYEDPLFNPPLSTFELTQKFANVSSPNVLPGQDVFTLDMRILPRYTVDDVMRRIEEIIARYEKERPGIKVQTEFVTRVDAPPPTPADAPVVQNLMAALEKQGIPAHCGGIGGGTCAAILRAQNIPAVVWSHVDDMCHQPNEYAVCENMVKDAQVFLSTILKY